MTEPQPQPRPQPLRLQPARLAAALGFLALALGLLGLAHVYVARRLILEPGLAEPWRGAALAALVAAGLALVAQPVLERRLAPPWRRRVAWPALLWLGVLWLLVVALLATDALVWLLGAAGGDLRPLAALRAGAVVLAVAAAVALGSRGLLRPPPVRRVELALPRWPRSLGGLRIVQVSDVHLGPILGREFAAELAARVNALAPDLVAVTGDLVDGSVAHVGEEVAPLAALRAPLGVFFVTGNHDHYSGDRGWVARVRQLGWRPLRNERVTLCPAWGEGARFELAGVDDHRGDWGVHGSREDLPRALAGWPSERHLILLAHDPTTFHAASRAGVDLQLSGHTHGGQIWPFGWVVRLVVPWVAGLHRRGRSQLYVSRGTGFWGPPLRLGAPAEITELVLRAEPPGAHAEATA